MKEQLQADILFREKLAGFEPEVPPQVWNAISTELHGTSPSFIPLYWRQLAASVALLIAFGAGYLLSNIQNTGTPVYSYKKTEWTTPRNDMRYTVSTYNRQLNQQQLTNNQQADNQGSKKNKGLSNSGSAANNQNSADSNAKLAQNNENNNENSVNKTNNTSGKDVLAQIRQTENMPDNEETDNLTTDIAEALDKMYSESEFTNQNTDEQIIALRAQELQRVKDKDNKWFVGGQFTPSYVYREMRKNDSELSDDYYNNIENAMLTYSGGFSLEYQPGKRWSIQSGISYSKFGQESEVFYAQNGRNNGNDKPYTVTTSAGIVIPRPAAMNQLTSRNELYDNAGNIIDQESSLIQDFNYIEIPVIMKYKLVDAGIDFNLIGGFNTNLLIGNKVYIESAGNKNEIGQTENLNPLRYSTTLGVGMEYKILRNFSMNIEPSFKYSLTPINRDNEIVNYPYSFGIVTGIYYKF